MNAEMPLIVGLLGQLSSWIRRPFWAFSTEVVPAVIEGGALKAGTSGGTSLECVLEHVAKTRPSCAVIVTDGYIEQIPKRRVAAIRGHAPARHRHARRESVAAQGRGDPLLAAREVADMIRVSEAVLPGHPDKLCDFVAESIVQAALAVDAEAYAQIEAAIWCDQLWLSGGYAARGAALDVERIAVEALDSIARAVNPDRARTRGR